MQGHIEELTGHRIDTCPWRALYHPLVGEAIRIASLADHNLAVAELGDDPPAILLDALSVYLTSRKAVRNHYDKVDADKRKKEHERLRAKNRNR